MPYLSPLFKIVLSFTALIMSINIHAQQIHLNINGQFSKNLDPNDTMEIVVEVLAVKRNAKTTDYLLSKSNKRLYKKKTSLRFGSDYKHPEVIVISDLKNVRKTSDEIIVRVYENDPTFPLPGPCCLYINADEQLLHKRFSLDTLENEIEVHDFQRTDSTLFEVQLQYID